MVNFGKCSEAPFQSTPSPRRETSAINPAEVTVINFNPLPPQGGRRSSAFRRRATTYFNPLPPQGGRPVAFGAPDLCEAISIHSLPKEGDVRSGGRPKTVTISIHSLPKEGDHFGISRLFGIRNFNPLPPQGGRLSVPSAIVTVSPFQSTPSPRRETRTR